VCICHRHTAINRQNSWFSFISRPSLSLHSPIFLFFFDFITTLFFPSLLVCCCYCSGWTLLYTELLYHRLYTHTHIEPVHTCIKIWCIYMRIEREWVYIDAFISYIYFCLYFHFFFFVWHQTIVTVAAARSDSMNPLHYFSDSTHR
jgi:hypothetical protein